MGKQCIVKERFVKKYRVEELDKKITKNRILNESRNLLRASKAGINVPCVYFVDLIERKIYMQLLNNSCQLKIILQELINDIEKYNDLYKKIIKDLGEILYKLHSNDIIHGDLTPSNIILKMKSNLINETNKNYFYLNNGKDLIMNKGDYDYMYLIDFGLSNVNTNIAGGIEDKAVDLYVLKRAIVSSNPKSEEMFEKILDEYEKNYTKNIVNEDKENNENNLGKKIVEHYRKVEMRGRKKLAFG